MTVPAKGLDGEQKGPIMGLLDNTAAPSLRPGKGAMLPLSELTASLLTRFTTEVVPAIGAAGDFEELCKVLVDLDNGWVVTADDFGDKVHIAAENGNGEYRLTLVKTKRDGTLNVDIRKWVNA